MDHSIRSAVFNYHNYLFAVEHFCHLRESGYDYWSALYKAAGDMSPRALAHLINEKVDKGEISDEFVKKPKKKPGKPEFIDRDKDDDGQDDEDGSFVKDEDGKDARKKPVYTKDETGKSDETPEAANEPVKDKDLEKADDATEDDEGGEDKKGEGEDKDGTEKEDKPKLVQDRKPLSKDADKVPLGKTVVLINPREREDEANKIYEFWKKAVAINKLRDRRN